MRVTGHWVIFLVLNLLLGGLFVRVSGIRAGETTWTTAAPMLDGRADHTATLLPTGQVLIAGGYGPNGPLASTELYNPATDTWTATAPMATARATHTATLLPNGRVLVVGGNDARRGNVSYLATATAEQYDPRTDSWTPVASMASARTMHTATLLPDGQVLVAGGDSVAGREPGKFLATVELYDPVGDRWRAAGSMATARYAHTATLLPTGQVLVTGGKVAAPGGFRDSSVSAERYDPVTNMWTSATPMKNPRHAHTATLLPNGHVLVVGSGTAELYDPVTASWIPTAAMNPIQYFLLYTATLLADGQVLLVGGETSISGAVTVAQRYDPVTNDWTPLPPPALPRIGSTATRLLNGEVLLAGGSNAGGGEPGPVPHIGLLYDDGVPTACFPETDTCMRGRFLSYWQDHGGLALNGYPLTYEFTQTLEDGKTYQVQYFERVRMEYHPENAPPYDVLLGQFGRRILQERTGQVVAPPAAPLSGRAYFPETGHNLGRGFLAYWQANGGLPQFGFPITEFFEERLEDGQTYQVQYFERARFEYHPENAAPFDILLGQFGPRMLTGTRR